MVCPYIFKFFLKVLQFSEFRELLLIGDKWRQRRKILNQSLSMNLMKEFLNKFNKIDDILLKILEANAKRGPVDILELTSYSTLDTTLG